MADVKLDKLMVANRLAVKLDKIYKSNFKSATITKEKFVYMNLHQYIHFIK